MNAKFVFSLALAAALPALADVTTANVIGVLPITSNSKETIIGIPWVAVSANLTEDAPIGVADIVKTANLSEEDQLWLYDSENKRYKCWQLNASKKWVPAAMVKEGNQPAALAGGAEDSLKRGEALVLVRNSGDLSTPFYVMGQVPGLSPTSLSLAQGTKAAPAYSLIAPPFVEGKNLNDGIWTGVGANDMILIKGKIYNYKDAKWGCWQQSDGSETFVEGGIIPAGQGVWFVSKSGTSASVQW